MAISGDRMAMIVVLFPRSPSRSSSSKMTEIPRDLMADDRSEAENTVATCTGDVSRWENKGKKVGWRSIMNRIVQAVDNMIPTMIGGRTGAGGLNFLRNRLGDFPLPDGAGALTYQTN